MSNTKEAVGQRAGAGVAIASVAAMEGSGLKEAMAAALAKAASRVGAAAPEQALVPAERLAWESTAGALRRGDRMPGKVRRARLGGRHQYADPR